MPAAETKVVIQAGMALPESLSLARSLRPFKRRWSAGRQMRLDIDATVRSYARTRRLVPQFRPAPERWFEVSLVVDDSPSMDLWSDVVDEVSTLLHQLAAFRAIRRWRIALDGPDVLLRSESGEHGPTAGPDQLRAPDGRRLILLVTDGSAPGWYRPRVWQTLHSWAASTPTTLISPLPIRLWRRTGLNLPATLIRSAAPGSPNSLLQYLESHMPFTHGGQDDWLPLPVATLSPYMLGRWARMLMRGDPQGCPALLIPPDGRTDGESARGRPASGRKIAEVFRQTASPEAARLAVLCAPFATVSLPLMRLIGEELVPSASVGDLAEVMMGRLFLPDAIPSDKGLLHFRPGTRERLRELLTERDAWRVYDALTRYISARGGPAMTFPDSLSIREMPTELQPFGKASRETLDFLGVTPPQQATPRASGTVRASGQASTPAPGAPPREEHVPAGESSATSGYAAAIWGNVPPRNKNFTGREDILAQLRASAPGQTALEEPRARVLQGFAGVGKTAVAIEYAYRYSFNYDLVWWVPADQTALVRSSIAALAFRLGLDTARATGIDYAAAAVLDTLRRGEPYRRWLLIFDHADQPEELNDLIPRGPGDVLITSRNERWQALFETIPLDVLTRRESLEFLAKRAPGALVPPDAEALAEALGDLPLALEQAGGMIAEAGMPVQDYLRLHREHVSSIMAEGKPHDYPMSMTAAWKLSVAMVQEQLPQARELLRCCAFFGPDPIPRDLFPRGSSAADTVLGGLLADPILLSQAIRVLSRFALIRVQGRDISVHRLVQALVRDDLDAREQDAYRHEVHALLAASLREDPGNPDRWPFYRELVPHVRSPVTGLVRSQDPGARATVLNILGFLYLSGDLAACRSLAEEAAAQWTDDSGPYTPDVLGAQRIVGDVLRQLGLYADAARMTESALAAVREVLGDHDPLTLALRKSAGADMRARGDFIAALRLDEETWHLHEEIFGSAEPRSLEILLNLAIDHGLTGRYASARDLCQRVFTSRDTTAPVETLTSWTTLAWVLRKSGDIEGAMNTSEEARDYAHEYLGPEHYASLRAMIEVSIALRLSGRYIESLETAEAAIRQCAQLFTGSDSVTLGVGAYSVLSAEGYPLTLAAAISLSSSLRAADRLDEAAGLAEAVVYTAQATYGPDHPFTHGCTGDRALLLRATGDPQAACRLNESALAGLDASLGRDHEYSLTVAANLASDLAMLADTARARDLGRDTLSRLRSLLGESHPLTLGCAANLAADIRAHGASGEAEEVQADMLRRYVGLLGEDHPTTRAVMAGDRLDFDFDLPPI